MSLALIDNGAIVKYPVGGVELRRANPQVSFPADLESADLSDYGIFTVHSVDPPEVDYRTERHEEVTPTFDGQQWNQTWQVVSLSPEELQQNTESRASSMRFERNQRLADCDWTQLADSPLGADDKAAWAAYRTALRAVPEQPGFPWDITWPEEP